MGRMRGAVVLTSALLGCTAAQAAGPWALGITQALSHETNVFRAVDANAEADTVSTTGVRVSLDQPIGRQRVTALVALEVQRYASHAEWNQNPYRLGAELDWSAADLWEGELGLDTSEQLFRQDQGTRAAARNLDQSSRAWLRARKGVVTDWSFEAAVNAFQRDLSLAASDELDQRQAAVEGGWTYQPSPALAVSARLRHTRGEFPRRTAAGADDYTRDDIELASTWQPTGASSLAARVAFGTESHSLATVSDTKVWNGELSWNWKPTGKLSFTTSLTRDSDTDSTRFQSDSASSGGDASTSVESNLASVSTSLGLAATWAATAKIRLDANVRLTREQLDSARTGTTGVRGAGRLSALSLGALYRPTRSIDLGCQFTLERRTVSAEAGTLSTPYAARSWGCFGQFWLGRN